MGRLIATAVLALLLAGAAAGGEREYDHERARRLVEEGAIVPLEALIEKARTIRPGRLLEVEFEQKDGRLIYELELLDGEGLVWELNFDAKSGELLEQSIDD